MLNHAMQGTPRVKGDAHGMGYFHNHWRDYPCGFSRYNLRDPQVH